MDRDDALTALSRFGMGASTDERNSAAADPRGWMLEQLGRPDGAPGLGDFPPSAGQLLRVLEARKDKDTGARKQLHQDYLAEAAARTRAGALTTTPVRERLVRFWSNHFTVSVQRPVLFPLAGSFEREAIRPYVTGRFADMLKAVARHPAMLLYLDNAQSVGPESAAGQRRGKGLNENLARELMELHTLGVDGGYSQADVEQLARVLTGWTVDRREGGFRFAPRLHEPGPKLVLATAITDDGEAEGDRVLDMLAHHPATARHVATKLARHFVADDPPPDLVEALARHFLDNGGDLHAVTAELVRRPEPWARPRAKMRSPDDYLCAVLRGFDGAADLPDKALVGTLSVMGQAPWSAPSPAGWPDRSEAWAAPESLMLRLEWARKAAHQLARRGVPDDLPVGAATRALMAEAGNRAEALFLALASPDFQRR
ncbi:MAG TPA: DUF1800 domain-containing protein [Magnetospirillum sp.]|nr:DUF1800 domain-containing protein [Magnetospirillum sp.]